MSDRAYPDRPIAGVGALIIVGDKILLVKRGREPLKGEWALPGGAMETGETMVEAVKREIFEETGLVVEPHTQAVVFDRILKDADGRPQYHYILADYLCRIVSGEPRPGDDVDEVAWFTRNQVQSLSMQAFTKEVIFKYL